MEFTTTLQRQNEAGEGFDVPLLVEAILTHAGDGWNEPHSTDCYILEARLPHSLGGVDVLFELSIPELRELEAVAVALADDWLESSELAAAEQDDEDDEDDDEL